VENRKKLKSSKKEKEKEGYGWNDLQKRKVLSLG